MEPTGEQLRPPENLRGFLEGYGLIETPECRDRQAEYIAAKRSGDIEAIRAAANMYRDVLDAAATEMTLGRELEFAGRLSRFWVVFQRATGMHEAGDNALAVEELSEERENYGRYNLPGQFEGEPAAQDLLLNLLDQQIAAWKGETDRPA